MSNEQCAMCNSRPMKDSGIEWIGEIPESWNIERNKNCFICSKSIVGDEWVNTQLLSLTTKGIKKKSTSQLSGKVPDSFETYQTVEKDNLVMCLFDLDCSAVFSGISSYAGMISPAYKVLSCKNLINPVYADLWFSFVFNGRKFKPYSKNLRYTLNYDEFAVLPIVLPPIDEQKKIAEFLDKKCGEIDEVIAKTEKTIEEYKALKQSVITEAVTKGIRSISNVQCAMCKKSRPMKDSGIEWIGQIPEEWEVIISRFLIDEISDIDHFMPASIEQGIPYIMTGDLKEKFNEISFEKCKQISKEDYVYLSQKSKPSKGDIIFARYATIGTVCFVNDEKECVVSYSCVTIKPSSDKLFGKYLFYYFKSSTFSEEIQQYITSNTQSNVGIEALYRSKIIVPSIIEQSQIADYLDTKCAEIDKLIEAKQQLLTELENYKKSVIYEYVTGKKQLAICN